MKYLIAGILFFLIPGITVGIELSISGTLDNSWLTVAANVTVPDAGFIKSKLETGQKAEIKYNFELHKKQKGFLSLFGDILVFSSDITFIAYKHLFFNEYVIEGSDNTRLFFENPDDFFKYFCSIKDYKFYKFGNGDLTGYSLLCRVTLIPEKLEPPLHIVSLLYRLGLTSDWKKLVLSGEEP